MELPKSSLWDENGEFITSNIGITTYSTPPRKRPKRLSVSCVERDVQDSFMPFWSREASIINIRVISLFHDDNGELRELECICDNTSKIYRVKLEGIWSSTPVSIGSSLRLIGAKMGEEEVLLNWESGVLIVEGNVLVPCTLIVQGISCRRKAILSHYFKGGSRATKEMLIGNVVHELFQTAISRSEFDVTESGLLELWREELHEQYSEQFLAVNLSQQEVEDELCLYFKTIIHWISTYMPPPRGRNESLQTGCKIIEVVNIEESIWDLRYGFKAKIDCTLKVKKRNGEQKLVPVELKTGKSKLNTEHVTQVMLYSLALASKQGTIENGLLLYLLDEISRSISPKTIDLMGILHLRNEIAANISAISFENLPEPVLNTQTCRWCSHILPCSLLQRCSPSSVIEIFFQDQLRYLTQSHIDYFKRFIRWILIEWQCVAENNAIAKNNICRNNLVPKINVILHSILQRDNKTVLAFQREEITEEQYEVATKGEMLSILSQKSEIIAVVRVIYIKGILRSGEHCCASEHSDGFFLEWLMILDVEIFRSRFID